MGIVGESDRDRFRSRSGFSRHSSEIGVKLRPAIDVEFTVILYRTIVSRRGLPNPASRTSCTIDVW